MRLLIDRLRGLLVVLGGITVSQAAIAANVLPQPEPPFKGKIGISAKDSIPEWPQPVKAPKGTPNIVLILLDDVGFSASSTFGGLPQTPELDKLAAQGLRYNNFNTVGVCSPTRAALLTGRNHHRVGFGDVQWGGFPGYNWLWSKSTASVAEVLRQNGYSTAAFGKWHNTPWNEISPVGPFNRWPTGLGFDYFYGFMGGEDSQWEPTLYRDTTPVEPPATPQQGYHLSTDLVDEAIRWVHTHESIAPEKPYFLYFATGATHEPHQVPKTWIEQYRGRFDQGWDKLREDNFARQKKLGVIPATTKLTPRPAKLPPWDSLPSDTRKLIAHQMEVFAAFRTQTDYEIGRLVKVVQDGPNGDNTLILYIAGDNGASGDGGPEGREDFGAVQGIQDRLLRVDEMGGPTLNNHYSWAWGWANSTPFQYVKKVASHFGATRDPLVVVWPTHIKDRGGLRTQFTHVNDVVPTIFDATGIHVPSVVNGVKQTALDGTSFAYSFDRSDEPSRHRVQYFDVSGNRAIYKDGWIAAARHWAPWDLESTQDWESLQRKSYAQDRWELYHVAQDFSEAHDLAARYPDKLKELQYLFDIEAHKNHVYPLGGGFSDGGNTPSLTAGKREFTYHSDLPRIPITATPDFTKSHRIVADLTIPDSGAQGVVISYGSRLGGFVLYVKDGRLIYDNNYAGRAHDVIASSVILPHGKVKIAFEFSREPDAASLMDVYTNGVSGTGKLYINGHVAGEGRIAHVQMLSYAYFGGMGIGRAYGSPVSKVYDVPCQFTGKVEKVTVEIR